MVVPDLEAMTISALCKSDGTDLITDIGSVESRIVKGFYR